MSSGQQYMETQKVLLDEVRKASKEGRLTCSEAFSLAKKLGVAPRAVGEAADEAGIKIASCQLGCFK